MTKSRKKLLIASLITMLSLNGCSINDKNNTSSNNQENKIVCEETYLPLKQNYYDHLEDVYQMAYFEKEELSKDVSFEYLIDFTNLDEEALRSLYESVDRAPLNKATFAHLVEDSTISNVAMPLDGKTAMTNGTFYGDSSSKVHQPILIPESFDNKDIIEFIGNEHLSIDADCCDLNCKKFITIDGQTLYYLEGIVGDSDSNVFDAKCLYQYTDNHDFVLLYRSQTGYGENDKNIIDANLNNKSEVVYPISETVFKDLNGTYKESYLREALDVYSDENNYYSTDNKNKDFSMYKKLTK